jgi:hypothetical protein
MQLQQKRRRGVFLTSQGLGKLQNAKQQAEDNNNHHLTLELLSHRTGLDSHTLCKIFNRTARVDKRSLAQCFQSFNLVLQPDDYDSSTAPSPNLNPTTVEVLPFGSILNEIERLSPENQKTLLDTLRFRLGDHR